MICRRALRPIIAAAALAVAGLIMPAPVAAQSQGPTVFTSKKQTNWLTLENFSGDLEMFYRGQIDEVNAKNNGPGSSNFRENRFEEDLTLRCTGSIYHPNLIFLDLEGTFGLFQSETDNNGQDEREDGQVYEWDINILGLRKQNVAPSLYSRRTRQLINRVFGPTLDSTLTTTGGILEIRNVAVPTRLELYHLDLQQKAPDDETDDFDLDQNTFTWHSEYKPTATQTINWDYTYSQVTQSTGDVTSDFDIHDGTLAHSLDFGDKGQHNLTSTLHYFNQTGDFAAQQFRWDELLLMRHTDDFETRYQYTYDKQGFDDEDQTTQNAAAGFTHHLYKSLVTNGVVGIEDVTRSDGSDSTEYYADLTFDYSKRVPYGLFIGSLTGGWSKQENSATYEPIQVNNQPRIVPPAQPIVIAGNGIEPNSIVVTDPSGLLIYIPGVDYTVDSFPGYTEINPILGGRMTPGETVLIDYTLAPQAANTTTTSYFSLGGRYMIDRGLFRGVGVFARYSQQDQTIDSDTPQSFIPNSFNDFSTGIDYRFWLMHIGAEYQWHDSTITPFNAQRYFARFISALSGNTQLTLNAAYSVFDYTDDDNHVELLTISANLQHRFSTRIFGVVTALWRDEQNDQNGPTQGIDLQLELQYRFRQLFAYIQYRNSQIDTDYTDSMYQFLQIGFRRDF